MYASLIFHDNYNRIHMKSMFLWMSIPETVKHKNNMGIIGNDMRINKIRVMSYFLGSAGRNNW